MQKALVTGANGFIGSALTRRLLRDGYAVRAMCRSRERGAALKEAGAEVIAADVQDPTSLQNSAERCDVVFHIAAVGYGSAAYQYNINVQGTRNIARAAHETGVQRFVHVSTIAVYGYELSGRIDESHPQRPARKDFYMVTKSQGEAALTNYAQRVGLPAAIVRPAMVYGPESPMWTDRMYDVARRVGIPSINNGLGHAHPIFIDDVVDLLVTAATHPAAVGNVFHAAPDPSPLWTEFLGYYARMAGNKRQVSIKLPAPNILKPISDMLSIAGRLGESPFDVYGAMQYITRDVTFSMDRAATLLGWRSRIDLAQGMALTEPWLRERTKQLSVGTGH